MKNNSFSKTGVQNKSNKIYDTITDTMIDFIESLKTNPTRWEQPWIKTENGLGAHNALSKRPYSGLNQLYLSYLCLKKEFPYNRWLTFKQVQDLGGRIIEGSKSALIIFLKQIEEENKDSTEPLSNQTELENKSVKTRLLLSYYNVFNVSQIEGLNDSLISPYPISESFEFRSHELAEQLMGKSGVKIEFSQQDEAYYTEKSDLISLPLRSQFKTTIGFYHTVFHEIGHWTGNPLRLNRKLFNLFGTEDYAREELTAEMCSVFVNSLCGIEIQIKNSAAYLDSWLGVLKKDKTAFIRSTMQAQTAANYILKQSGMEHLKQPLLEEHEHI